MHSKLASGVRRNAHASPFISRPLKIWLVCASGQATSCRIHHILAMVRVSVLCTEANCTHPRARPPAGTSRAQETIVRWTSTFHYWALAAWRSSGQAPARCSHHRYRHVPTTHTQVVYFHPQSRMRTVSVSKLSSQRTSSSFDQTIRSCTAPPHHSAMAWSARTRMPLALTTCHGFTTQRQLLPRPDSTPRPQQRPVTTISATAAQSRSHRRSRYFRPMSHGTGSSLVLGWPARALLAM